MIVSIRDRLRSSTSTWGRYLVFLAIAVFMDRLGQGLLGGASTNFFVRTLGLSGKQVLWLTGIREIPGLTLMFLAALAMHLPLSRRAGVAMLLMGVGYGLYAVVHSYVALLAVAVLSSIGFHSWMPLQSTIAFALTRKEQSGRVMGTLASMGALASIMGMGITALLATTLPLRSFFIVGGIAIVIGAIMVSRIPTSVGERTAGQSRLLLRPRYWLYYVLTFFEGSRMQVFSAFGTLVLVQDYGLDARRISLLLLASGVVNFVFARPLGRMLDVVGERVTLSVSYVALALCFVGYATVHNVWFLCLTLIVINLLVTLSIGLSTYVNRIAPKEELGPTLSAGVSVNHITSVSMSLVAGSLLSIVGYEWLCWGAAGLILISTPFAMAIKVPSAALQSHPETAR